ncbi:hypothetical protein F4810DRAFT_691313 [Camillea tinctor]|nr:hypothetical protein F4810DRAFT_691313 [Camillea tinctor]
MDLLWRKDVLLQHDTRVFRYRDDKRQGKSCTTLYARSNDLKSPSWLKISERRIASEWDAWFTEIADSQALSQGDSIRIILCPRDDFDGDHSAILKCLPFSSESFNTIAEGLELHRSLAVLVERGVPTISRIPCSPHKVVYTLRAQHNMEGDMALTITYFKGTTPNNATTTTAKTHAMLLGCSDKDTQFVCDKLSEARATAFSPFTLIKAFLELEMGRRFRAVDKTVSEALRAAEGEQGMSKSGSYPNSSVEAYTDTFMLKTALEAWKAQLVKLVRYSAKDFVGEGSVHADDVDPREYLEQLIYEYDIKIAHCERVLQVTSLTFQMQTTDLTRQDGREMRAIALLTMVFLPATFVATVMAVPTFDFRTITSIPQWSIYLVLFLPLTAVVLVVYFIWHRCLENRDRGLSQADMII